MEPKETKTAKSSDDLATTEKNNNTVDSKNEALKIEQPRALDQVSRVPKINLNANDDNIEKEFREFLENMDAQELSDIVLNYVDDEDVVRAFLNSSLDIEMKEGILEGFKDHQ